MDNEGVEGEALSSPKGASTYPATWKAENLTARARLKGIVNWIAEHELWLLSVPVTLMLLSGRLPIWIISASLLLIPIPWVCRWAAKGYMTARSPMDLPIVVLLSMALVGLYPSVDSSMSEQCQERCSGPSWGSLRLCGGTLAFPDKEDRDEKDALTSLGG
ncbi:MAG: hypothetical protein WBW48_08420 [Anaerolineae bacterium]